MRTNPKLISLCLLAILTFSATYVVFSDDSSADSVEQDYTRYYYNQLDSELAKKYYNDFRQISGPPNYDDEGRPAYQIADDPSMSYFDDTSVENVNGIYDEIQGHMWAIGFFKLR